MSMKDRIGDYRPKSYGGRVRLDWKAIIEQNALPLSFYLEMEAIVEIDTKEGETAIVYEGKAELDTTGLSEDRITELENITQLKRDKPTAVSFFSPGSMFLSQMTKAFQNKTDDAGKEIPEEMEWQAGSRWEDNCIGEFSHIRYNGKVPNTKRPGQKFHQIWVDYVPKVEQVSL